VCADLPGFSIVPIVVLRKSGIISIVNPAIFEAGMLICWGAAWPFSIYKMLRTKKSHGKSIPFLVVILLGYVLGMFFQYFGDRNAVMFLYISNSLLIIIDIMLTIKYRH